MDDDNIQTRDFPLSSLHKIIYDHAPKASLYRIMYSVINSYQFWQILIFIQIIKYGIGKLFIDIILNLSRGTKG